MKQKFVKTYKGGTVKRELLKSENEEKKEKSKTSSSDSPKGGKAEK